MADDAERLADDIEKQEKLIKQGKGVSCQMCFWLRVFAGCQVCVSSVATSSFARAYVEQLPVLRLYLAQGRDSRAQNDYS
eukprot:7385551-Prymnesium_polylepis.1